MEGIEEDFFLNKEQEEEYEVLSVSHTPLGVEHGVGGVEFSDFPCLSSGQNSNLTSDDIADLRHQGIAVDDEKGPSAENITYEVPRKVNDFNWNPEGIIFPGRSKNLHRTYAASKTYSHEGVTKMMNLELFSILFPIDYPKEVLIPKKKSSETSNGPWRIYPEAWILVPHGFPGGNFHQEELVVDNGAEYV